MGDFRKKIFCKEIPYHTMVLYVREKKFYHQRFGKKNSYQTNFKSHNSRPSSALTSAPISSIGEGPGSSDDVTCHFVQILKSESDIHNKLTNVCLLDSYQVLRILLTWELQPQAAMLKKQ